MTYGEMEQLVLQLLNRYSVAGEQVPITYNDQADLVVRIPALIRDGLYFVTTTVRRLRAVAELEKPRLRGQMLVYDLPADFYQMAAGLLRLEGNTVSRYTGYHMLGGKQILIPRQDAGLYQVEYFRYPTACPEDSQAEVDCPPEAQTAVALYAAAHLAMEDDNFLYGALYSEFERKMAHLQEGVTAGCQSVTDVYGAGWEAGYG